MSDSIVTSLAPHLMRIERQVNAIDRRLADLEAEITRRGGVEAAKDYVPPEQPTQDLTIETSTEKPADVARRIAVGLLSSHKGPVSHGELVSAVVSQLNEVSAAYASSFKKNPGRVLAKIPNIRKYKDGWGIRSNS